MHKFCFVLFVGSLLFTACNYSKGPDDADLRTAINAYQRTHGKACSWIGQLFPVDVSESRQSTRFEIASKMAVLEQAGLVQSTSIVITVPEMFGPSIQRRVKRYQATPMGKQYLQTDQTPQRQSAAFCYGTKEVDSIVNWVSPNDGRPSLQTEVTYTYKIPNLASWAQRSDVQNEFADIRTTIMGISKANQVATVEFTNKGWQVPTR